MPSSIPDDFLARFILDKRYSKPDNQGHVKYNVFLPPIDKKKLSVYRIQGLDESEVWAIGDTFVASVQGKPLIARADILAEDVIGVSLSVTPEPAPHPRHADITGWPDDRPAQREYALRLARAAKLRINPDDIAV